MHQSQRESTLAGGRIRVFIEAAVHAQGQDRSVAAFLVTSVLESERHPELAESNHDSREFTRGYVKAAIKDAVESGEVRADIDIEAAARC